jgi:hypothetical protein
MATSQAPEGSGQQTHDDRKRFIVEACFGFIEYVCIAICLANPPRLLEYTGTLSPSSCQPDVITRIVVTRTPKCNNAAEEEEAPCQQR